MELVGEDVEHFGYDRLLTESIQRLKQMTYKMPYRPMSGDGPAEGGAAKVPGFAG